MHNMSIIVLDSINFRVDVDKLLESLNMDRDSEYIEHILRLAQIASEIGKPKVMYKEAIIDVKGQDYVIVDGIKFSSHILRINLDSVDRIFPYVCTCGSELSEWAESLDDMLEQYWLEKIMEMALDKAVETFESHMEANFKLGITSNMNPGSIEDWPISQQRELFALLDNPYEKIGVKLTDSYLMLPMKSVSGIRFSSDLDFINCQLCARESCERRRAGFDEYLYKKYKEWDK